MRLPEPIRAVGRRMKRVLMRGLRARRSIRARVKARRLMERSKPALREIPNLGEGHRGEVLVFGVRHQLTGGTDWHTDRWSSRTWPLTYHRNIDVNRVVNASDVKWPWELSRCQFLGGWAVSWVEHGDVDSAEACVRVVGDWMRSNPYGIGINWTCAMEVGIRAINWLFARSLLRGSPAWTDQWDSTVLDWLMAHAEYIAENLEDWGQVSQNHLIADLTGALCIWAEIGGPAHRHNAEWARDRLEACMLTQVYADGVSFENSTAYHMFVSELFIMALACGMRNGITFSPAFRERLQLMVEHTAALKNDQGRVPQVGDSDDGRVLVVDQRRSASPRDIGWFLALGREVFPGLSVRIDSEADACDAAYAVHWMKPARLLGLGQSDSIVRPIASFPEGGLFVLSGGPTKALAVLSPTGVSGTGPHRHNDALSVVVDVHGESLLVDSGTYCYQHDPEARRLFRSGRAHNTAMVDGIEHNDIAAIFAMDHDQMRTEVVGWGVDESHAWVAGRMRSFENAGVFWTRSVSVSQSTGEVSMTDEFTGCGWPHEVELFWHFAPGVRLEDIDDEGSMLRWCADGTEFTCDVTTSGGVRARLGKAPGWYSEQYRVRTEAPGLVVKVRAGSPVTLLTRMTPHQLPGNATS